MGKYLTVDEQATYIGVVCDGYVVRVYKSGDYWDDIIRIFDPTGSTELASLNPIMNTAAQLVYLLTDPDYVAVLMSSHPTRVWIRATGNFYEDDESTPLTNSTSITYDFYIYADKIAVNCSFVASGDVTTTSTSYNIMGLLGTLANITNEASIAEDSGSEDQSVLYGSATGDYAGFISDEINIICIDVYHTDDTPFARPFDNENGAITSWEDGTLASGVHTITSVWHIDSADRENDGGTFLDWDTDIDTNSVTVGTICEQSADSLRYICHTAHTAGAGNEPPDTDYWWEYRMTLGDQYKDLVMAAPTTGSEVTDLVIPKTIEGNDFSIDSNCKAVWNFESGALTTDSKGGNTLTDVNTVGTETSDYQQGSACADLEVSSSEKFTIADGDLDSGFPFKSGGSDLDITVCGWFKLESIAADVYIVCKGRTNYSNFSFAIGIEADSGNRVLEIHVGYNGGVSTEVYEFAAMDDIVTGRWYHLGATFKNSTKLGTVRLWDDTAGSVIYSGSHTFTNAAIADNGEFHIGGYYPDGYRFDGLLDELVVFDDILTATEIDQIRKGIYGHAGFASDGGRHLEMASDEIKYTVDTERIGHVDVIEDPPIETGTVGSATDHLVGHWKMDDNAASTTIVDSTSRIGDLTASANTDTLDVADSVRGANSLQFDSAASEYAYITFATSGDYDIANFMNDFSISMYIKPTTTINYNTAQQSQLFHFGQAWDNRIRFYYDGSNTEFRVSISLTGAAGSGISTLKSFSSNAEFHQWHKINFVFSLTYDIVVIDIDNERFVILETGSWGSDPTAFRLNRDYSSSYGEFIFDNVKLIDGCLLPYGAYFTGNGAVDVDHAHEDITCFVKGDEANTDALKIGTGTMAVADVTYATDVFGNASSAVVINSGNDDFIIPSANLPSLPYSLSFWFKGSDTPSGYNMFFSLMDAYSEFSLYRNDNDASIVLRHNGQICGFSVSATVFDNNWHHILVRVAASAQSLEINGVVQDSTTTSLTAIDAPADIYLGNENGSYLLSGSYSDFYIINNPNTPQIPVILGSGPIHAPIQGIE